MIALVVGLFVGPIIVLIATRSQGQSVAGQILTHVERIGAVFYVLGALRSH